MSADIMRFVIDAEPLMKAAEAAGVSIELTVSDRSPDCSPQERPDGLTITARNGWFAQHPDWHDAAYEREFLP